VLTAGYAAAPPYAAPAISVNRKRSPRPPSAGLRPAPTVVDRVPFESELSSGPRLHALARRGGAPADTPTVIQSRAFLPHHCHSERGRVAPDEESGWGQSRPNPPYVFIAPSPGPLTTFPWQFRDCPLEIAWRIALPDEGRVGDHWCDLLQTKGLGETLVISRPSRRSRRVTGCTDPRLRMGGDRKFKCRASAWHLAWNVLR
jgi:hypothetical protein